MNITNNFLDNISSHFGYNIIIAQPLKTPNYILSSKINVSDTFRIEFQQWLDSFFGVKYREVLSNDQIFYNVQTRTVYCNSYIANLIKTNPKQVFKL